MKGFKRRIENINKTIANVGAASRMMKQLESSDRDFDIAFRTIKSESRFAPSQKEYEIRQLFDLIKKNDCNRLCEIGTLKGGTFFLLCQSASANAKLISVDINMPLYRSLAYKRFARRKQKVYCIEGDSKVESTFKKVQSILRRDLLDFLFIDGDHSYEGVKNDFEKYSVLVKKGGFIAFHDIMELGPDSPKSYYVGGVPRFWKEIKANFSMTREFVENPDQDGFGIGVLRKDW